MKLHNKSAVGHTHWFVGQLILLQMSI